MKLFNLIDTTFENFDASVANYLSKIFSTMGIQFSNNQILKILFNGFKGIMQNILVYIEDAFTEQNIETAIRKKSIYSLAKLSGYEPFYGTAATGTLIATSISNTNDSNSIKKIYINNHSNIINVRSGENYVLYLQSDRYVFDVRKPLSNYEFRIVQGFYHTSSYTCRGNSLETIHLNINGMFDANYIRVFVNNIEWQQVSNLYDMTEDGEEYILKIGFDNEIDITFGNGIYGKIPEAGTSVLIEYITHSGTAGNIDNILNTNFSFSSKGLDVEGNQINLDKYIKLSLDNYISGGTNSESISDVKQMIGFNSRSNVLASIDNYRLFLKRFSFIGNFNIWAENNSNILCINAINNKINNIETIEDIENLDDSDLILTDIEKSNVLTVLKNSNNTFAGISVNFIDPVIYKYAIICYVKIVDQYYKEAIEMNIKECILDYFKTKTFNITFISKSDLSKYILNNVEYISSLDLEIVSHMNEQAFKNKYYYKYDTLITGNKIYYQLVKYNYESDLNLGLDDLGNISIDNSLYIPLLGNNVTYYPDKSSTTNINNFTTLKPINIVFI